MFGLEFTALASAIEHRMAVEEQFQKYLLTLPESERQKAIALREEEQRLATEERRHQEVCAAIRSTSFWRF